MVDGKDKGNQPITKRRIPNRQRRECIKPIGDSIFYGLACKELIINKGRTLRRSHHL